MLYHIVSYHIIIVRPIYYIVSCHVFSRWCIFFEDCIFIYVILILIILSAPGRRNFAFIAAKQLIITFLCQVADHVSVNCWLSRRSICFSLLLSRTSSLSHPRAVMRWCVVRMSALQLLRSILMFDSYHDPVTDYSPACIPAFSLFMNHGIFMYCTAN